MASPIYLYLPNFFLVHPCDSEENGGCEGVCVKQGTKPKCACKAPMKLAEDKMSCIPVHPCEKENGGCKQLCERKGSEAYCACKKGFGLSEDGKSCEKVHPCEVDNGGCSHGCKKVGAKAECLCKKDYTLQEDGTSCVKGKRSNCLIVTHYLKLLSSCNLL